MIGRLALWIAALGVVLLALAGPGAHAQGRPPGYEPHVLRLAGADAVRCGSLARGKHSAQELQRAIDCATAARREGKAFFVAIGGVGIDSFVAEGIAGLRDSPDLYSFSYDSAPCGGPGCPERFNIALCKPAGKDETVDPEKHCRMRWKVAEAPPQGATERPPPAMVRPQRPVCEFKNLELPKEFVILAAGAYEGRKLGYQIDQSGHEATRIDVAVNEKRKPVVLMLGAYEPTVWSVSWSKDTRIVAVMVSGYHRQALAGLDPRVPVLSSTHEERGGCDIFYVTERTLDRLNPMAQRLFQRDVDLVFLAKDGKVVVGEPLPSGQKWVTSSAVRPESFHDRKAPLSGGAALEDAVARGLLRKATPADSNAWRDAFEASRKGTTAPVVGEKRRSATPEELVFSYVVLKPFVFPPGIGGMQFYIPKGTPRPTGDAWQVNILDFNKLGEQ